MHVPAKAGYVPDDSTFGVVFPFGTYRVQIETDRLSNAGAPGQISQQQGTKVDADLSRIKDYLGYMDHDVRARAVPVFVRGAPGVLDVVYDVRSAGAARGAGP